MKPAVLKFAGIVLMMASVAPLFLGCFTAYRAAQEASRQHPISDYLGTISLVCFAAFPVVAVTGVTCAVAAGRLRRDGSA